MSANAAALIPRGGNRILATTAAGQLSIDFAATGNSAGITTAGWSTPEQDETWSAASRCVLTLPCPADPLPQVLRLALRPHVLPGKLPAQRIRVSVNGHPLTTFTIARRAIRACRIPWALLAGHPHIEIAFDLPDAARPADLDGGQDRRLLGIALSNVQLYPDLYETAQAGTSHAGALPVSVDVAALVAADRMPLKELMVQFESLGQNCEFGLVQRRCEAEPLGLLRFSSTPLPKLLAALDAGFAGMGEPANIAVQLSSNGREYMISDARFGFLYHAFVESGAMSPEDLHRREARRVPFLIDKLLDDLGSGSKIFVFKGMGAMDEEEVFPLAMALRRHGPNTLLFVTLADDHHPPGSLEVRAPGFLVGYLSRFAPTEDASSFELAQWVKLCRAAYRTRLTATAAL